MAFVGGDVHVNTIKAVCIDDVIILKRGLTEIRAAGKVVARNGCHSGCDDKHWLRDFDGWDLSFLIVPLLLALGWPEQSIKIEQPTSDGRIDIALFRGPFNNNPQEAVAIIETKGFAQGLLYAPIQACNYAKDFPKCRVVFVSNGYCYKAFVRKADAFTSDTPDAYLNIRDPRDAYPLNPQVHGSLELLGLLLEPLL